MDYKSNKAKWDEKYDFVFENFGPTLKRRISGVLANQNEMAVLCGITSGHLSSIIKGRALPSLEVFVKLCIHTKSCPTTLLNFPPPAETVRREKSIKILETYLADMTTQARNVNMALEAIYYVPTKMEHPAIKYRPME